MQVVAAIAAAGLLCVIASGKPDWVPGGFASNGYGALSPGKYAMSSCFLIEVVMTFFFLIVIIGTTSKGAATGFAGIPIGLALTLIHLVASRSPTPRSTRRAAPGRRCSRAAGVWASSGCSGSLPCWER